MTFDSNHGMWILSRYPDVLAAMREPALRPVSAKKSANIKVPNEAALRDLRARILDSFSPANLAAYQEEIGCAANTLPSDGPLDLISEFTEPLCAAAAEIVTGAKRSDRKRLLDLAATVSRAAADPFNEDFRAAATVADAELESYFTDAPGPMAASTFVALSRTTSCLLANGWLALLSHPGELTHLLEQPDHVPKAVEEILRYSGVPEMLFRYVPEPVTLCGRQFAEGDRLMLRLATANRDPAQFTDPDRFCANRREVSHLALGFGPHACAGGALIRMVAAAATRSFVDLFASAEIAGPVEWQGGPGFRSVSALPIRRRTPSQ